MRKISLVIAAVAVAGLTVTLNTQQASAATINFAPLAQDSFQFNDAGGPSNTYSQDGFTFTNVSGGFGGLLGAWCTTCNGNNPVGGVPATSLVQFYAGSTLTMTSSGGNFSLQSIDLAQWGFGQAGPAFAVTFDGHLAAGGDVLQTFSVSNVRGRPVLNTYYFSGFDNLTQVTVQQEVFDAGAAFQLNNIVERPASATPLPAALPLFATGLGVMDFLTKRRKRKDAGALAAA